MKTLLKDLLSAVIMGFALPAVLLNGAVTLQNQTDSAQATITFEETQAKHSCYIGRRLNSGDVIEEPLEEYLIGVVLAEMPGEFENEALKAQAVAARTYTRKADLTGGKHGDGSICGNSSCCQAYLSPEDYRKLGGSDEILKKIRSAVLDTAGQVLTYDEELIEATYFSCSGGYTEDAQAVWGGYYPYLVAVPSPGEEAAAHYQETRRFTAEELEETLGVHLNDDPDAWLGTAAYTKGGGVEFMVIGDMQFTGTQLRSLLGLRSTAISAEVENGELLITTKGYGHRVGMSQYGADAMAVLGYTYDQILTHYYPGTTLTNLE